MRCMSNLRLSAPERLEQLHDFVAEHERAPSRRTGQQEERSLGEWVAKHKNVETPTGVEMRARRNNPRETWNWIEAGPTYPFMAHRTSREYRVRLVSNLWAVDG